MRIAFVTNYFSNGMGYTENMLPKALAFLGHEVHVVTSTLQVYGNQEDYIRNYETFLGPAKCLHGESLVDGFTLHRLPFYSIENNIGLCGLRDVLHNIRPTVVQFGAAASLSALTTLLSPEHLKWPVFTENHQHLSVAWRPRAHYFPLRRWEVFRYRLTRTWPVRLAHKRVEKCFAIADDCLETAYQLYGIPRSKIVVLPLGTDTEMFRPCCSEIEHAARIRMRQMWDIHENDILCVYTGRLSTEKNPLLLAQAIANLRQKGHPYRAVFIGEGKQCKAIQDTPGCTVVHFMKHVDLACVYRAAEIGVWPSQESMSMLDAAASGLPLVVSDKMGELERVSGNGCTFRDGDVFSLMQSLYALRDEKVRLNLSLYGRHKMVSHFSWKKHADARLKFYDESVKLRTNI